ncbi:hypothetical protein CMMCAY01_13325 [Clavibacter michiganensis subsp. michiganensis]|nr:hypothetical protein CMMCAY01_13325 [Clavibacter michiganensis subsp. michiganensis]
MPRRATRTCIWNSAAPNGPRASDTSSASGSPDRRTRSTMETSSGWTSAWWKTRPEEMAPGDAFITLLEGSSTMPADSSASSTWSTPSGTTGFVISTARSPRSAAWFSSHTNPAPTANPMRRQTSTNAPVSMRPH